MAAVITPEEARWSRARARGRWSDLEIFLDRPLGLGLLIVSLWPAIALVRSLPTYEQPVVAVGIYLGSLGIIAALWRWGRTGLGWPVSVGSGIALAGLNVALTLQVPADAATGTALWLHGWGAAVPMVLAFSRPLEEPLAVLALLGASNAVAVVRGEQTVAALHDAPLRLGIPIAMTAAGIALVVALRRSVSAARRSRDQAAVLWERERIREAIEQDRSLRRAEWEHRAATLLEEIGDRGRVPDAEVAAAARALREEARLDLDTAGDSVLELLMKERDGVELVLQDLDVGHRLREVDRVRLVAAVGELCRGQRGRLEVTLQPAGLPGEPVATALVVLAGTGIAPPEFPEGTLTVESPTRWFLDLEWPCVGQTSR